VSASSDRADPTQRRLYGRGIWTGSDHRKTRPKVVALGGDGRFGRAVIVSCLAQALREAPFPVLDVEGRGSRRRVQPALPVQTRIGGRRDRLRLRIPPTPVARESGMKCGEAVPGNTDGLRDFLGDP